MKNVVDQTSFSSVVTDLTNAMPRAAEFDSFKIIHSTGISGDVVGREYVSFQINGTEYIITNHRKLNDEEMTIKLEAVGQG